MERKDWDWKKKNVVDEQQNNFKAWEYHAWIFVRTCFFHMMMKSGECLSMSKVLHLDILAWNFEYLVVFFSLSCSDLNPETDAIS